MSINNVLQFSWGIHEYVVNICKAEDSVVICGNNLALTVNRFATGCDRHNKQFNARNLELWPWGGAHTLISDNGSEWVCCPCVRLCAAVTLLWCMMHDAAAAATTPHQLVVNTVHQTLSTPLSQFVAKFKYPQCSFCSLCINYCSRRRDVEKFWASVR